MTNISLNQYNALIQHQIQNHEKLELVLSKAEMLILLLQNEIDNLISVNQESLKELIERQK